MAEQRLIEVNAFRESMKERYRKTEKLIKKGEKHLDRLAEGFMEVDELLSAAPTVNAVVLPCNVGDTVYEANPRGIVSEYTVRCFKLCSDAIFIEWELVDGIYSNVYGFLVTDKWGKTVFATREAAEAALAERRTFK